MNIRTFRVFMVPVAALLLFAHCDLIPSDVRPIGEVRQGAPSLEGKSVKVKGKVVDTTQLPFVATRFYKLQDGTGELWITTTDPLPGLGETLEVAGRLHNAAVLGGASMGIQIKESYRSKVPLR